MMGRENCDMCQIHSGKTYCDYYDAFCLECVEVEHCPNGLDDDPDDYEGDEYPYEDEDYMREERESF